MNLQLDRDNGRVIIPAMEQAFDYTSVAFVQGANGQYYCKFNKNQISNEHLEAIENREFIIYQNGQPWFNGNEVIDITVDGEHLIIIIMLETYPNSISAEKILISSGHYCIIRNDIEKPIYQGALIEDYIDVNLEQGVEYQYTIFLSKAFEYIPQQTTIKMDFEDIFLNDKQHQLRIQYNPKVSSFKTTVAEQKTDTIGAKYPFFFRNGNLRYKEFPISGLISYHMDDLMLFDPSLADEFGVAAASSRTGAAAVDEFMPRTPADEVYLERKYKRLVLDWLNNGQPKVFRSPTEGNFIVRLMNVSLSPNDQLGRRLHTFQATAYEIDEYSEDGLSRPDLGLLELVKDAPFYYSWKIAEVGDYIPQSLDGGTGLMVDSKKVFSVTIDVTLEAGVEEKLILQDLTTNAILVEESYTFEAAETKSLTFDFGDAIFVNSSLIAIRTVKSFSSCRITTLNTRED